MIHKIDDRDIRGRCRRYMYGSINDRREYENKRRVVDTYNDGEYKV